MMRSEAHGLLGSTRLSVFGRPAIEHRGTTVPLVNERRSQLLAYLAIDGGWVERDRLAALLWPDHDTAVARRNLRKIVFRAREMDWAAALESQGECLRWTVDSDLFDFRAALAAGQPDAACAVYGGRLLEGLDDARNTAFQAWLDAQRAGLHRQWRDAALRAMPRLANAALRAAAARRLVDDDPLDEPTLLAALAVLTADGNATQAQGLLRDYLRRLTEEIGRPPSAAVLAAARTVVEPLSAAPAALDAPATIRPIADHQRRAGDAFVGRRSERRELLALLGDPGCRVVTVLGPGGIGKSRFAREQLPELLALTQSDVLWVALEDLATAAQLRLRIAQALGTPVSDAGDVVAQIVAQRGEKATLLVLDNAEHLPELADWLQPLLAAWPRLRLLLTSRARVGLADERLLPLGGLAIPDAESRDLEAAVAFDAVRLFELRARRARPGFDLAAHLDAVVALLERVDGMPLAIEWAADWVRLLPPGEIVRELDRSIDILQRDPTSGDGIAAGHLSLQAVFHRSWELLAEPERRALAALTVFRGGFRSEAAGSVAGASWPLLAALVDRSLLTLDAQGRFGMHPLVAAWAARLVPEGERAALAQRHAEFFASWLAAQLREHGGAASVLGLAMQAEIANCERAWQAALATERGDLLQAMRPALLRFAEAQGRWREVGAPLAAALASDGPMQAHPKLRVELLLDLSAVHYRLGDLGRFEALARAAEPLARELGQPGPLSAALGAIGVSLQNRGELDAALLLQQEAVALARRSGDRKQLATMLHNTAMVHKSRGTLPECHGLLEEALAVMREIGHDDGTALILNALGDTLHLAGKLDEARSTFEAGLQLTEERGLPMRQQIFRLSLGHVLIDMAQHDDARALLERARADGQRNGHFHVEVYSLLRLARLDLVEGHADASLQRCREVFRRARAGGFEGIALEALVQHTDWLDRHGDTAYARQLRTWLLQASALPSLLRQRLRDLLAANPGGTDAAVPPGFDLRAAAARLAALPPVQA